MSSKLQFIAERAKFVIWEIKEKGKQYAKEEEVQLLDNVVESILKMIEDENNLEQFILMFLLQFWKKDEDGEYYFDVAAMEKFQENNRELLLLKLYDELQAQSAEPIDFEVFKNKAEKNKIPDDIQSKLYNFYAFACDVYSLT
jgi:hypothetical protein